MTDQAQGRQGVLAIIPARGGSKGLPRKNVLPLGGLPLIAWTVRAALGAPCVVRTVVSTDDVVAHVLESLGWQGPAVLLQPTSPFRTARDIEAAHTLWRQSGAPGCVSVCAVEESPWLMFGLDSGGALQCLLPEPPVPARPPFPAPRNRGL